MEQWQSPETIILWIVITIAFFLVLIVFIVILIRAFFKKIVKTKLATSKAKLEHQHNLLNTTIQTQERERERIAADLHDDLISKLTVVNLQHEKNGPKNSTSITLINECINTTRRISHNLSPPLLEFSSLAELINDITDPWKKTIKITSFFDIRNENHYSHEFKIQFIRIIQEMLTNIRKHANASEIIVHLKQTDNCTVLRIADNGKGYKLNTNKKGLGLTSIETRVQYLNGKYRIQSTISKGTSALFLFKTT